MTAIGTSEADIPFSNLIREAYAENAARKNDRMIARRIDRACGHRVRLTERVS